MRLFIFLFIILAVKFKESINLKIVEIIPTTKEQVYFLKNLKEENSQLSSFLSSPVKMNEPIQLLLPPEKIEEFNKMMNLQSLKTKPVITNTKRELLNKEFQKAKKHSYSNKKMDWLSYHSYETICDWMTSLVETHPNNIELFNYGTSFENRSIVGVKLSYRRGRKGVFMEGGLHGSSYISPATVTYILNEFLTTENKTLKDLARRYDWYFVPLVNPDSYVYSMESKYVIDWIKTRSYSLSTYLCPGVNADRNFKYEWNELGSSSFCCSDLYAGPEAFSEPETRSLARFLQLNIKHMFAYLSFQNYGQNLMVPYGHTNNRLDNFDQMIVIAQKTAVQLHRKHKTKYRVGTTFEVLDGASGTSTDWVKACLELPVVMTYLMRPKNGFQLDPECIIANGEEVIDSLVVLFNETYKLGYGRVGNEIS